MKRIRIVFVIFAVISSLTLNSCTTKKNDPVIEEEVVDVSGEEPTVGNFASYYIDKTNQLWSWGRVSLDKYFILSQLGVDTEKDIYIPVKILDDVIEVIPGYDFCFAIKKDKTLWAWGVDEDGSLGAGADVFISKTPIQILDNVKEVKISTTHVLALKMDGTLLGWGGNYQNTLGVKSSERSVETPIQIMENVTYFTTSSTGSMAVTKDNSLWIWGMEFDGKSNDDHNSDSAKPKKFIDGVQKVYFVDGSSDYYLLKTDDTLWGWGENADGYIGDGSSGKIVDPVLILRNVLDFKSADNRYALQKDYTLRGWGSGNILINRGSTSDLKYLRPEMIMENVKDFEVNFNNVVILDKTKKLWTWGDYRGSDETLDLSILLVSYQTPTLLMDHVVKFDLGRSHGMASDEEGLLWKWGDNFYGQYGSGNNVQSGSPTGSSFSH